MKFEVKCVSESMNMVMRKLGYQPAYFQGEDEFSMVKPLTRNDYPRFHLYVKEFGGGLAFNLHLDQKKPSYGGGSHAHSGEYEGPLVEREAARIKSLLGF